jgi:hypothetical protein
VGLTCEENALKSAWCHNLLRLHLEDRESIPSGSWLSLPSVSENPQTLYVLPGERAPLAQEQQARLSPVVAITGAARGIGKAIARTLAGRGYKTALFDMDQAALRKTTTALQERGFPAFEVIGDVRGVGLMIGFEFVKDRTTKEPGKEIRDLILRKAFENGLALLPAGESTIRVCPPLTIEKEDIDTGLGIIADSIESSERETGEACRRVMGASDEA